MTLKPGPAWHVCGNPWHVCGKVWHVCGKWPRNSLHRNGFLPLHTLHTLHRVGGERARAPLVLRPRPPVVRFDHLSPMPTP
jgi:hypothetical protein